MKTLDTISMSQITRYVPLVVQRRLANAHGNIDEPQLEMTEAALLFADVSGFTRLTELMAAKGSVGVEQLTATLNDFFGVMIRHITLHGGDVIKFAGDAVISVFEPQNGGGLDDACARAASCALALQAELDGYRSTDGIALSVKTTVAGGKVAFAFLGGVWGRWELVLFGSPLIDAGNAADSCTAGEVVLAACAASQLGGVADLEQRPNGDARLVALHHPPPPQQQWPPELDEAAQAAVWKYVPGAIRSRLRSGQAQWLAELRTVSVLFITMPGHAGDVSLSESQALMVELQNLVYGVEGSVNKISADDKGLSLVAVLGMPPLAHEDDPRRAMVLALGIGDLLRKLGYPCSIGVTTGRVFCGVIGSDLRCEYTTIGDAVNLSARLMVASRGDILCDQTTYEATRAFFAFDAVEPLKLKGKADRVPAYQPRGALKLAAQMSTVPMVARRAELEALLDAVRALGEGKSAVVGVQASAGMGKSTLIAELMASCGEDTLLLKGASDSIERNTPYIAWRSIIATLVGVAAVDDVAARRTAVLSAFSGLPKLAAQAAVLEAVVPLGLEESPEIAALDGQARAFTLSRVVAGLIQHKCQSQKVVVVLEDTQWLDSASWTLTAAIAQTVAPLCLVLVTRPMVKEGEAAVWTELSKRDDWKLLELTRLDEPAVAELIANMLNVRKVPNELVSLLHRRAEGNPFFTQELTHSLRDMEVLSVKDGVCSMVGGIEAISNLELPTTVEGVVTQRIDALAPTEQLALKVASVIGRVFGSTLLNDVFPVSATRGRLDPHLTKLVERDLTTLTEQPGRSAYLFKHVTTQEVAYNLMLHGQRRSLHAAIGEWFERNVADLDPYLPLLAHHFERAEDLDKAVAYGVMAADRALADFGLTEGIALYGKALELDARRGAASDPDVVIHCNLQVGYALQHRHDFPAAEAALRRGLALTSAPAVTSAAAAVAGSVYHLALQWFRRRWPQRFPRPIDESERNRTLALAWAHERLLELVYIRNWLPGVLWGGFRTLDLAQRLGPSDILPIAQASMALVMSSIGADDTAKWYEKRARVGIPAIKNMSARCHALFNASLARASFLDYEGAQIDLLEVAQRCEALGDFHRQHDALIGIATQCERTGNLDRAAKALERARQSALSNDYPQTHVLATAALAMIQLPQYNSSRAANVEALQAAIAEQTGLGRMKRSGFLNGLGRLSVALLQLDRPEEARAAAAQASSYLNRQRGAAIEEIAGFVCCADTLLDLTERGLADESARKELTVWAGAMRQYAKKYRNGRPIAARRLARIHALDGRHAKALKTLRDGLKSVRAAGMYGEEPMTLFELAKLLSADDPERKALLEQALRAAQQVQARFDEAKIRALLSA